MQELSFSGNDPDIIKDKDIILQSIEEYKEALEDCNRKIKENPEDIDAWVNKGTILFLLEQYDDHSRPLTKP